MIVGAAEIAPHLPVGLGLVAGTLAKFGLDLEAGVAIAPRKVLGHCMMLALLALLADTACDIIAGCPPTARAIAGAGAALLSARLVKWFRDAAEERARQRLGLAPETKP